MCPLSCEQIQDVVRALFEFASDNANKPEPVGTFGRNAREVVARMAAAGIYTLIETNSDTTIKMEM